MRITSLVENTSNEPLIGSEHGLSLYIETARHKILFDMGQTELFSQNAKKLGVDLSEVDIAFLSHGHYDHGGGLSCFLRENDKAPVFVSQYAFEPHYNASEKYNGLNKELQSSNRLILTGEEYHIDDGLTIYSCNNEKKRCEIDSAGLLMEQNGHLVPEDFRHEQYLLIEEKGKRVLISGCSHKGIINIVEWFRPDYLIGGFHFMKHELNEELKQKALILDGYNTEYYTCHCTGAEQYAYMQTYIKKLRYLSSGQSIEL